MSARPAPLAIHLSARRLARARTVAYFIRRETRSRRLDAGLVEQDKVAQYLYNCPEYIEGVVACFKARLVHVNVNYRYQDDELLYIFDNSDAKFVFVGDDFVDRVENLRSRLPGVGHWLQCGEAPPAAFAESVEVLSTSREGAPLEIKRSLATSCPSCNSNSSVAH